MTKAIWVGIVSFFLLMGSWTGVSAEPPQTFRITFKTQAFGPIDAVIRFTTEGGGLEGRSSSGALSVLREMALDPWHGDATLRLKLRSQPDGSYSGVIEAPHVTSKIGLRLAPGQISGAVSDGPLAGPVSGAIWAADHSLRNYSAAIAKMDTVLVHALFDPNQLQRPQYLHFRDQLGRVAAEAQDDADVVFAFPLGWDNKVFSHFGLQRQARTEIVAETDATTRPAIELSRRGDIAILRVNTFLGDRATEQLKAAFATMKNAPPSALIIDLRATPGGSLSVRALLNGLLTKPEPLGWFVANAWWRLNKALPTPIQVAALPLDTFDDPQAAGQRLGTVGALRVGLAGSPDAYTGKVFVLIDRRTVSVAELAAATLKGLGRATLIGERTAGELLTADTIPLDEGFSLYLPLGDYFDARLGRIEGRGVDPDVASSSEVAFDRALAAAR